MATQVDVRSQLNALPDTLIDAYGEIYQRILAQKGSAPRLALKAFQWIQCSYEPLRAETLLDAITVQLGASGEFSHSTIQANDLLKACQNLVILDKQLNVFRLAHISMDEFLDAQLRKVDSHTEIAEVCLSLLCSPGSWNDYDSTRETRETGYKNRHLLLYSAVFWPWHLFHSEDKNGNRQILTRLWDTFVSGTTYQEWLRYHGKCVHTSPSSTDHFWLRSWALQQEGDDVLSSVCVFELEWKFATIVRIKTVNKARVHRLLRRACISGDLGIARLLIDAGADTSAADNEGWTPLDWASDGGHEMVARLLVERGATASAADGWSPLHWASEGGHEAVARFLIDQGADVSAASKEGWTPLHWASEKGRQAVVQLLVDRGADVSVVDKDGWTPLHWATDRGREAVVQFLIDRGADVSVVGKDGRAPLHWASEGGHEAVVQFLIDRRADVSAADTERMTPLHLASRRGHEAVARLLAYRGADPSAADKDGKTPLHWASKEGYEGVARLLVDQGASVSAVDGQGQTPLHFASKGQHEEVVKLLVDREADVTATDHSGWTPLWLARAKGHSAVARLLVDRIPDVSTDNGMM